MRFISARAATGAVLGLLSAACGVAAGELLGAATRPQAGPLVAVGGTIIDATPTPVKEFAVRELGTADKPVLLGSIAVVLALFAAAVGVLGARRRVYAIVGAVILGLAGAGAALSRPTATLYDAVPSLFAAALAGVLLTWSLSRVLRPDVAAENVATDAGAPGSAPLVAASAVAASAGSAASVPGTTSAGPVASGSTASGSTSSGSAPADRKPSRVLVDRRAFLTAASVIAGGAIVAGGGAQVVKRARGGAITASRAAIKLPAAADPAKPLPAGVAPGFVTTNDAFYRVDTALTVPRIDVSTWSLRLHGMVGKEMEFSFEDLLNRPLIERDITLNCVSNEVGGPYIGTARWLGVPLAPLLREAGLDPAADQIVARSVEGMTIGTPVSTVLDGRDTMLCLGMNGEPLPLEHGFPVRMLTPGLYGYAGACKWITELKLTTFADFDAYWVSRKWAAEGPVKTASRIDKPQPFSQVPQGRTTIAGVAWAQRRGIKAVEVRVDDGDWQPAELLPTASTDTWVQWRLGWDATEGPHTFTVRATDGTGTPQPEARATPFPSGATGWHNITVTVT